MSMSALEHFLLRVPARTPALASAPVLAFVALALGACAWLVLRRLHSREDDLAPLFQRTPDDAKLAPWAVYKRASRSLGHPILSLPPPHSRTPLLALLTSLTHLPLLSRVLPFLGLSTPHKLHVVVLNTAASADALLARRRDFACRPTSHMGELMGRQNNVTFTYYGERLRRMRRCLHDGLNPIAIKDRWADLIERVGAEFVKFVRDAGEVEGRAGEFYDAVGASVQETIVLLTYGVKPDEDYIRVARGVMAETFVAMQQPSPWLVDAVPALRFVPAWFPGASFKRFALASRARFASFVVDPFFRVQQALLDDEHGEGDEGGAPKCFVADSIAALPEGYTQDDLDVVRYTSGSVFSAASDTITSIILSFILLMLRNPAVADTAHAELRAALGSGRLPVLLDSFPSPSSSSASASAAAKEGGAKEGGASAPPARARDAPLPYLEALVREVHRFHPAAPLIAHSNTAEGTYEGVRIPTRSRVVANVWAITHDETYYPNPDDFDPGRHLVDEPPPDPREFSYGFGRRRCPGRHLANAIVWVYAARLLLLYKIVPERDGMAPPPFEFTTEFITTPKPFRCRFIPREGMEELLAAL